MSNAEKIRENLFKNPKMATNELARLLKVSTQQIYNIRYQLRKKELEKKVKFVNRSKLAVVTRETNSKSLAQHVLKALNGKSLTELQIADLVKEDGYHSNAAVFLLVVRQCLYSLCRKKILSRKGNEYVKFSSSKVECEILMLQELAKMSRKAGGIEKLQSLIKILVECQL